MLTKLTNTITRGSGAVISLLFLFGLAGFATRADAQAAPQSDVQPYPGIVMQDQVIIRAGGGDTFYPVGVASKGTMVQVLDTRFDWFRIRPLGGMTCYARKEYVMADPDGKGGQVIAPRCRITLAMLNGSPGDSYAGHWLDKGARVRIVGQEGDFYKIAAPENAVVWLPPGSIRRATNDEIALANQRNAAESTLAADSVAKSAPIPAPVPAPAPSPASEKLPPTPLAAETRPGLDADVAVQVASTPAAAATSAQPTYAPPAPAPQSLETSSIATPSTEAPVAEVAPNEIDSSPLPTADFEANEIPVPLAETNPTDSASASATATAKPIAKPAVEVKDLMPLAHDSSLQTLERTFKTSLSQAITDRPIEQFQLQYQVIEQQQDLTPLDRQIVRARLDQLRRMATLASMLEQVEQTRKKIDHEIATQPSIDSLLVHYDAVGLLVASSVYNGDGLPRLYRLVDATSRRTMAYIRPSAAVDAAASLGRVVGVVGPATIDSAIKARIINPVRVDVLNQATKSEAAKTSATAESAKP